MLDPFVSPEAASVPALPSLVGMTRDELAAGSQRHWRARM
jgi:hypothetical protein